MAERLRLMLKELFETICDVSAERTRIKTLTDWARRCCRWPWISG